MSFAARSLRAITLIALPLGLGACVVAPAGGPPIAVGPAPLIVAPAPARRCWMENQRVWTRDAWGRPVQVVRQRQVCA